MMYMKDTMLMFIGGLVIALAVQHCNLHQRMALKVISIIGCSQRKYVNEKYQSKKRLESNFNGKLPFSYVFRLD